MSIRKPAITIIILVTLILTSPGLNAQGINSKWKEDLTALMGKFVSCMGGGTDKAACSAYIGESIAKTYKLNGIYSEKQKRYLQMAELNKALSDPAKWTSLGHAYDQKVLDEAQQQANAGKAVVAMYTTPEGVSHIALILPGDLSYSGTWGFKVPNSASFVMVDHAKSYVGKGLSYAFTRGMLKDVVLYAKKY